MALEAFRPPSQHDNQQHSNMQRLSSEEEEDEDAVEVEIHQKHPEQADAAAGLDSSDCQASNSSKHEEDHNYQVMQPLYNGQLIQQ